MPNQAMPSTPPSTSQRGRLGIAISSGSASGHSQAWPWNSAGAASGRSASTERSGSSSPYHGNTSRPAQPSPSHSRVTGKTAG